MARRRVPAVVALLLTACASMDARVISLAATSIDPADGPLVNQLKAAAIAKYVTHDRVAFDDTRRALIGLGVPGDSLPGLIVPNGRLNRYLIPKRIFFDDYAGGEQREPVRGRRRRYFPLPARPGPASPSTPGTSAPPWCSGVGTSPTASSSSPPRTARARSS